MRTKVTPINFYVQPRTAKRCPSCGSAADNYIVGYYRTAKWRHLDDFCANCVKPFSRYLINPKGPYVINARHGYRLPEWIVQL